MALKKDQHDKLIKQTIDLATSVGACRPTEKPDVNKQTHREN